MRFFLTLLLALVVTAFAACRGEVTQPATSRAGVPAAPPRGPDAPRSTEVIPRIATVTPSTIAVSDGHAGPGSFTVDYEIANVDRVDSAELRIYAPGVGVVQRVPVSPKERDTITVDLDPTRSDFGPKVAFRARCPGGDTDWYVLGTERLPDDWRDTETLRVVNVSPDRISLDSALIAGNGDVPEGGGVPVSVLGHRLTADCTPEATVNGVPVELYNVVPQHKKLQALLLFRDFGRRYVSSRYLEVQLGVAGAGFRRVAIKHITFVE